jgi:hypothetical protein
MHIKVETSKVHEEDEEDNRYSDVFWWADLRFSQWSTVFWDVMLHSPAEASGCCSLAEDQGSIFLWNVPHCTALHPRRWNSSLPLLILTPNIIADKDKIRHGVRFPSNAHSCDVQTVAQSKTKKRTQSWAETCIHIPFITNYMDRAFVSMVTGDNDLNDSLCQNLIKLLKLCCYHMNCFILVEPDGLS